MAFSWKSFDFFDVSLVAPADNDARRLFEANDISSVCEGSDSLFVGSDDGSVAIIGRGWKLLRTFHAHEAARITHMRQVDGTSILVTVAEDLSSEPVLKAWALDKLVKKTGMPTCLSTLTINNGRRQFPISAFAALDDLSQVAVGFANGAVTVIRGDLIHDLGTKQRIVYESDDPVTGLQLATDEKLTTLFVSTTSRIVKLGLSRKGQGLPPKTVESAGCAVGCMTLDRTTGNIVVAREDAIYTYSLDGRGPPRAYESPKSLISLHGSYTALACPSAGIAGGDPDAVRRRFGAGAADALYNASSFMLLDTDLRIIAHTETLLSPVRFIFGIWGDVFTIDQNGKVFQYHEKTLQQRLEMLYQRNMYALALELARNEGLDSKQRSLIYRKYGDYLYQKADYDGSMVQYIRAMDTTEPSQVIRKFLDTQRIHNLIQYLEQLHEQRRATSDHTTLLLNCYAKLKDIDKLEAFIKSPGDLKFDLETAIAMCRQGGYYEQAAYLAKRHGETELVVDILMEDSKSYAEALDWIWRQEAELAYPCMKKYAHVLIENCPREATRLFVDYHTGKFRPKRDVPVVRNGETPPSAGFAANAVQNLSSLLPFPYMTASSAATPVIVGTAGEPSGQGVAVPRATATTAAAVATTTGTSTNTAAATVTEAGTASGQDEAPPAYTPPPPRTAFSSFIDHPDEFIVFLEACAEEKEFEASDRTDLYTTLFEMYLQKAKDAAAQDDREGWEEKAKKLIAGEHVPMESSNVLLLSHLSNFEQGTRLVKEQAGLLSDIFRSYTSARDTRGAMKALRKYGPEEPQLYPAALAYLSSDRRALEEAGAEELTGILAKIDKDGLMGPLQVIQTLVGQGGSRGEGGATMGMVKPYLRETIARERREIAANQHRIDTLRADTEKRRSELAELGSKPAVFQATRCSECGQGLDLPTTHFLCKHSFHQRCLRGGGGGDVGGGGGGGGGGGSSSSNTAGGGGGGEKSIERQVECPKCAGENEVIRKMCEGQRETAKKHDLFKADMEGSEDRLATIAQWFSRGVMDAAREGET